MIEIFQENCSSTEFYNDLKDLVNKYSEDLVGKISINITDIVKN